MPGNSPYNRLRREILSRLYESFKTIPLVPVDTWELAQDLESDPKEITWNICYLEMSGLVSLHGGEGSNFLVHITSRGVDLMEDPGGLERRFPVEPATGSAPSEVGTLEDLVEHIQVRADLSEPEKQALAKFLGLARKLLSSG